MTQTETSARQWVNQVVSERGQKATYNLMVYNVTQNQYFKQSNQWIEAAWKAINELNPS
jgi:hypothetical protein